SGTRRPYLHPLQAALGRACGRGAGVRGLLRLEGALAPGKPRAPGGRHAEGYGLVKSVSCIPSGARTRAFRPPHAVITAGAPAQPAALPPAGGTASSPAVTRRAAIASLSAPSSASRPVPDPRSPASIRSTIAAWSSSRSPSVALPPSSTTTRPDSELQSASS